MNYESLIYNRKVYVINITRRKGNFSKVKQQFHILFFNRGMKVSWSAEFIYLHLLQHNLAIHIPLPILVVKDYDDTKMKIMLNA